MLKPRFFFFHDCLINWKFKRKKTHQFKNRDFFSIINVLNVTFNQFNVFLWNKSITIISKYITQCILLTCINYSFSIYVFYHIIYDIIDIHWDIGMVILRNSAQSKILLWEWEIRGQKNEMVQKNSKSLAVSGLVYHVQASLDKHLYDLILTINGLVFPAGAFLVSYDCFIRCAVFTHNNKSIFCVQIRKWLIGR